MRFGSGGRGNFDSGDALRLLLRRGERWSAVNGFCGKGVGRFVRWCFSEEGVSGCSSNSVQVADNEPDQHDAAIDDQCSW